MGKNEGGRSLQSSREGTVPLRQRVKKHHRMPKELGDREKFESDNTAFNNKRLIIVVHSTCLSQSRRWGLPSRPRNCRCRLVFTERGRSYNRGGTKQRNFS